MQATYPEIRLLVDERALNENTSRANWVLLSVVNRALRNQFKVPVALRTVYLEAETNGVDGLQPLALTMPSHLRRQVGSLSIATTVHRCLAGWDGHVEGCLSGFRCTCAMHLIRTMQCVASCCDNVALPHARRPRLGAALRRAPQLESLTQKLPHSSACDSFQSCALHCLIVHSLHSFSTLSVMDCAPSLLAWMRSSR